MVGLRVNARERRVPARRKRIARRVVEVDLRRGGFRDVGNCLWCNEGSQSGDSGSGCTRRRHTHGRLYVRQIVRRPSYVKGRLHGKVQVAGCGELATAFTKDSWHSFSGVGGAIRRCGRRRYICIRKGPDQTGCICLRLVRAFFPSSERSCRGSRALSTAGRRPEETTGPDGGLPTFTEPPLNAVWS